MYYVYDLVYSLILRNNMIHPVCTFMCHESPCMYFTIDDMNQLAACINYESPCYIHLCSINHTVFTSFWRISLHVPLFEMNPLYVLLNDLNNPLYVLLNEMNHSAFVLPYWMNHPVCVLFYEMKHTVCVLFYEMNLPVCVLLY